MTLAHYYWKKRARTNTNELLMFSDTVTSVFFCPPILRFLEKMMWKNKAYASERGCTAVFIWAPEPHTDQYTFKLRLEKAITISHLIRKRQTFFPNYHLKWLVSGDTSWMLIEAYFIFIQQIFYISTWAHNCLIYMHTHTFIYSHNSQWAQSILPSPFSAPCS